MAHEGRAVVYGKSDGSLKVDLKTGADKTNRKLVKGKINKGYHELNAGNFPNLFGEFEPH